MEFLLYDVTSTFFEVSAGRNSKAAWVYSRDQRIDCKQVCAVLVCTPEGLSPAYEVFAGSCADVATVEDIVQMMKSKYGTANRVLVMGCRMVSEKNIAFLRERKVLYIVAKPKSDLRHFEAALLEKRGLSEVSEGLEVKFWCLLKT